MNNLDMQKLGDAVKHAVSTANRGKILRVIKLLFIIAVVVWGVITIQRAGNYNKVEQENKELKVSLAAAENELVNANKELEAAQNQLSDSQEQLEYAEGQVELLENSTAALKGQITGLNSTIDELNSKIEDLLNVEETMPVITRNQLEDQLSAIRELVTTQYFYRNATRKEANKTWLWGWTMPFSDISLLAAYDGTIKAGIDLSEIKVDVNEANRTITVILPKCRITDHNIPQETINVLEVKNNIFNEVSFDDYNQFISEEKNVMEEQAIERGLLTDAYNEAKAAISAFLSLMPGMDTYELIIK